MIRAPEVKDLSRMIELTKEVYGEFMKAHGAPINDKNLEITVMSYITHANCLVAERSGTIVGMVGWQLFRHPANFDCVIFQEALWCMKSDNATDALILLRAIEAKAIELKANIMILANLSIENEPKLRRIYGKRGFKYLETHYAKTIGG